MNITDQELARRLLEAALAGEPALSAQQVSDLMSMAEVTVFVNDIPHIEWSDDSLRRAAAVGWGWKSALTADKYSLGGGDGRSLSEQQWWEHCSVMADKYRHGHLSVTTGGVTGGTRPSGIRSIGMVSSAAVESTTWPAWVVNAPETD